jgi:anti-sigma regulatory factor (Ser/Thr protein kinase)
MVDCLESSAFSRDRLPAIAASVATVRRIVLDFMDSHCNADPQLRSDVALCVSEAAGNSIAHAFPAPGGAITLIISQVDQALTVEICDEGVGRAAPAQTPGLGVGIQIIRALSDATFEPVDESGLRVIMRFPCPSR